MRTEASHQFFENRINEYDDQPVQAEHRQNTSLSNVRSVFNKNNQTVMSEPETIENFQDKSFSMTSRHGINEPLEGLQDYQIVLQTSNLRNYEYGGPNNLTVERVLHQSMETNEEVNSEFG